MREIIHIQAGRLSNFIGTHYFNTLETYFASDDEIDHNVSFREGIASDGSETFCPRLLLFDFKDNFGALSNVSALYSDSLGGGGEAIAWDGPTEVNRQPPIERSDYQLALDEEELGLQPHPTPLYPHSVKHWSDFNRVYHAPRSLHPLRPHTLAGASASETLERWDEGAEFFHREDADSEILESDFRHFAEECDLLQGVQTMFDFDTFAPFTLEMLGRIHDELPKAPIFTIPSLSTALPQNNDLCQVDSAPRILNEALALRGLFEISNLTVPLQSPSSWKPSQWSSFLDADFTSPYHSSAILAAHVESVTLPLRSQRSDVDMRQFCDHVQGAEDGRFAQLCGAIPAVSSLDEKQFRQTTKDFSTSLQSGQASSPGTLFSQWTVVRGFSNVEYTELEQHIDILRHPMARTMTTALPYPLPTSYPQFFDNRLLTSTGRLRAGLSLHAPLSGSSPKKPKLAESSIINPDTRLTSVPVYSALRTTSAFGNFFSIRAAFVDNFLKSGSDLHFLGPALGRDEMIELREDLARIAEAHGLDSQGSDRGAGDSELDI